MTEATSLPSTIEAVWHRAVGLIEGGQPERADAELRQGIARFGEDLELLHLRAVALLRLGLAGDALPILERLAKTAGGRTDIAMNLGHALLGVGRHRDAIGTLSRIVEKPPAAWEAYYLLGLAHERDGSPDPSAVAYEQALKLNPDLWDVRLRLMSLYRVLERFDDAIATARAAATLRPDEIAVQHDLAMLLALSGSPAAALAEVDIALERHPQFPEALNTRGNILGDLKRWPEAVSCYRKALVMTPSLADAHYNLGNLDRNDERYDAAIRRYRRTLSIAPAAVLTRNNLALAHLSSGDIEAALQGYSACIAAMPNWPDPVFSRSLALLLKGDMRNGLQGYEVRWQVKSFTSAVRLFPQPLWDGSPFAGRRLFLHAEQGDGDTIQFARYLPLIRELGKEIVLECPTRLVRLLRSLDGGVNLVRAGDPLPPFDLHLPLGSVMHVFRTEIGTIPANVPYLQALPELRTIWQGRLATAGLKVGLTWQGNPIQGAEPHRSIPLALLAPLLETTGARFFALQKEFGREQMNDLEPGLLDDIGPELGDYADTAAAIAEMDLVITTCTSVAHLAGALGKEVWVLVRFMPDWRWLLGRDDSPWYPTARLFRQQSPGDWAGVVDRVVQALAETVRTRAMIQA